MQLPDRIISVLIVAPQLSGSSLNDPPPLPPYEPAVKWQPQLCIVDLHN